MTCCARYIAVHVAVAITGSFEATCMHACQSHCAGLRSALFWRDQLKDDSEHSISDSFLCSGGCSVFLALSSLQSSSPQPGPIGMEADGTGGSDESNSTYVRA